MALLSRSLIALISKYYEPLSLLLFALYRFLFNYAGTCNSLIASLVFPMLTLKLKNYAVRYTVILTHFDIVNYLIGHDSSDLLMWTAVGLVVLGISEYMIRKDKHVFINLIVCNLAANIVVKAWNS